jgi:nitrate reductase beta subunit
VIIEKQPIDRDSDWIDRTRLFQPMPGHPDHMIVRRSVRKSEPDVVELEGLTRAEYEALSRICERCMRPTGECECPEGPIFKPDPVWENWPPTSG